MSNFIDHGITNILGWKRRADRSGPSACRIAAVRFTSSGWSIADVTCWMNCTLCGSVALQVDCSLVLPARVDEEPPPAVNGGKRLDAQAPSLRPEARTR
jgi:hypothetical protein